MDQMNPVSLFLKSKGMKAKKGGDKPKQVKPNAKEEEPGGSLASLVDRAIEPLEELKSKLPQESQPASEVANALRSLTILRNRLRGLPLKGATEEKSTETALPGSAEIDMQNLLTGVGPSLVSNPSPGGEAPVGGAG